MKKLYLLLLCLSMASPMAQAQPNDFSAIVEQQGQAVVNIATVTKVRTPEMPEMSDPFFEFFFRNFRPQQGNPRQQGQGSGFIISQDGYIVTNAHVVDGADQITVRTADRREFKGRVIGQDNRTDIALVKVEATGLPKVTLGDSGKVKVGEWVVAMGSPFGFENSVTAGILSGKFRFQMGDGFVPMLQTDAPVNPGNSGGPLFNTKGEVIGVNARIYNPGMGGSMNGNIGLSFAIPIEVASGVVDQLRKTGKVTYGFLGVTFQEMSRELAQSVGLSKAEGVMITKVGPGTPAEKAGIQVGDVILKVNDKPVVASHDIRLAVTGARPGTDLKLGVWRNRAERAIVAKVAQLPDEVAQKPRATPGAQSSDTGLGIVVRELRADERRQLGIRGGLLVTDVTGSAQQDGLQAGDVILSANQTEISSVRQFRELLQGVKKGDMVPLLVQREADRLFIPVKKP